MIKEVEVSDNGKEERLYKYWINEINNSASYYKDFLSRFDKIVARYRDEENIDKKLLNTSRRFNLFWSSMQVLKPAIYSQVPKPVVERRYKGKSPVGLLASEVLERSISYEMEEGNFDCSMDRAVWDYLLGGRGVIWVRYSPVFEKVKPKIRVFLTNEPADMDDDEAEEMYTDDQGHSYDSSEIEEDEEGMYVYGEEEEDQFVYESIHFEYIFWKDYLQSPSRTEEEKTWVARCAYLTKKEVESRFGEEVAKEINYKKKKDSDDGEQNFIKSQFAKAEIYEIWDKVTRKVYWISKDLPNKILDEKEDPMQLKGFFPCRSVYSTMTNDTTIPVPDYAEYQDILNELDVVFRRQSLLVRAIKVVALRDQSVPELDRLLQEAVELEVIPVKNWIQFTQQGGMKAMIDFLPLREMVETLLQLYTVEDRLKQKFYEISGISDVMRGATNPYETATAQNIKYENANSRLGERRKKVQELAKEMVALAGEIIAEHFSPETIAVISDAEELAEGDFMRFQEAIGLLQSDTMRCFKVQIETDSTIALDEQEDKQARLEFVTTISGALKEFMAASQTTPQILPLMGEFLLFAARGFRAGRVLETSIKTFIDQTIEMSQQMPPPQVDENGEPIQQETPDPNSDPMLIQAKLTLEQQKIQAKQAEIEARMIANQQLVAARNYQTNMNAEIKSAEIASRERMAQQKMMTEYGHKSEELRAKKIKDAGDLINSMNSEGFNEPKII